MRQNVFILVCALTALVLGFMPLLATMYWKMETPAVPYGKSDRIIRGLSLADVTKILGDPTHIDRAADGSLLWTYCHKGKWAIFRVDFSPEGTVENTHHDW